MSLKLKNKVAVITGGNSGMAPLEQYTEELFDKISDINYKGVFFTVQKALPYLNDGASIVITSSTVSEKGLAGGSAYIATKAAERALVRVFAAGFAKEQSDAMEEFFANAVALKRGGTVEEMAKGFLFLASDDSSYMTGGELLLDGGFRDL